MSPSHSVHAAHASFPNWQSFRMFQALGHVLLCVLKSCKKPWWTWNFHCWKPKRSTTRSESQRSIAEQDCTVSDSIMWIDWTNVCCISLMLTVTCAPKGATKRWWLSVAVCAQADPAQRNSAERLDDIGGYRWRWNAPAQMRSAFCSFFATK